MVALVRGVHGLRGAVRVEILTDRPTERFAPGAILYREGRQEPLTIASAEAIVDGPGWRVQFRELTTRDGADTLRGAYLESLVRPEEDLSHGSYYWHEVIGTPVRDLDGAELGTVEDIYRVGETEVFVVSGGSAGSFDLPAVRAFIRIFAPRRGEIVVDPESLDLHPTRVRDPRAPRPKAPRRRSRRPTLARGTPTEAESAVAPQPEPEPAESRRSAEAPSREIDGTAAGTPEA